MKRTGRKQVAEETVRIVSHGSYESPTGRTVDIADSVRDCLAATRYFPPDALPRLRRDALGASNSFDTLIEVVNETTLAGIAALSGGPVAALNFASAKNPGGGFLNGSEAQEESLARSSALYASQQQVPEFCRSCTPTR